MRSLLLSAVSLLGLGYVGAALAGDTGPIRIGVITDLSGQNSDVNGVGAVEAVKMAVEDFKGQVGGRPVEVLFADHQNKPDVAALIARKWIEEGVDMLADISGSAPALAVNKLATDSNRVAMSTAAVSTEITGKSCSPNVVQFVMDTYAMAAAVTVPMSSRFGKEWYFITLNFGFGIDMEATATKQLESVGGRSVGSVKTPFNTADFSSYILAASGTNANVLGLVQLSEDLNRSVRQAKEFGLTSKMKIGTFNLTVNNVKAMGLETAQGLYAATAFYWDFNDNTRAFSNRFKVRHPRGNYPSEYQTGDYAATLHYLKAVQALGGKTADGAAVVAKMKEMPTDDIAFGKGVVRADGRGLHPMYLFEVKAPGESKYDWDYYKLISTLPAEQGAIPLKDSLCSLVAGKS